MFDWGFHTKGQKSGFASQLCVYLKISEWNVVPSLLLQPKGRIYYSSDCLTITGSLFWSNQLLSWMVSAQTNCRRGPPISHKPPHLICIICAQRLRPSGNNLEFYDFLRRSIFATCLITTNCAVRGFIHQAPERPAFMQLWVHFCAACRNCEARGPSRPVIETAWIH